MKIRSITYFTSSASPVDEQALREAGAFLRRARAAYKAEGYEVQTVRIATLPFPKLLGENKLDTLPQVASQAEGLIRQLEVGYLSLGPALPATPRSYEVIPEAIAATQSVFFGGVMADDRGGVDLQAVRRCAEIIVKCAPIEPNGFANLRFAALANVKPGSPFFPAAHHEGAIPAFALATEAADLAVEAFTSAPTVEQGRKALVAAIEMEAKRLAAVGRKLKPARDVGGPKPRFGGIDFSLAPFPEQGRSLGTAFERLGVERVGLHGSLAAAAILTEAVDRARFTRAGFSGLFIPVLEDSSLATRAAEGTLTVKDLLLYSAVCGTGLDTVPLPGDVTAGQIAALLLDVAALSSRLNKPLTARLMPIPNKKAGDATGFRFDYFANSKVMRLEARELSGALGSTDAFELRPRLEGPKGRK